MADAEDTTGSMLDAIGKIPELVNKDDVIKMIDLQASAIGRLEATNYGLESCTTLAQNKLNTTTKLFKRTAKQMNEAKKDLDIIYKKLIEMKAKIKADESRSSNNPSN